MSNLCAYSFYLALNPLVLTNHLLVFVSDEYGSKEALFVVVHTHETTRCDLQQERKNVSLCVSWVWASQESTTMLTFNAHNKRTQNNVRFATISWLQLQTQNVDARPFISDASFALLRATLHDRLSLIHTFCKPETTENAFSIVHCKFLQTGVLSLHISQCRCPHRIVQQIISERSSINLSPRETKPNAFLGYPTINPLLPSQSLSITRFTSKTPTLTLEYIGI